MIIQSELDQPEDIASFPCRMCGVPLKNLRHHWVYDRWLHATCHDRCAEEWTKQQATKKPVPRDIPQRFDGTFDFHKARPEAMRLAQAFSPDSLEKTLAIIGVPARGKSRLMWEVVRQYFDEWGSGWVDYFLFEDLISELDRAMLSRLKTAKHAFVDNIGGVESYGRERAQLQSIIRTRVSKGMWTFLTIDNLNFDPGLENLLKDRAVMVVIDQ